MSDSPHIEVPETLDGGRYKVERVLGVGGSATVLLAHDTRMGVDRAIKILHPQAARSIQNRARFRAEAHAQARLKHPNVLMVHDAIEDAQGLYLVMELAESDSVGHRVREEGPLPADEVVEIGITIGRALVVAHAAGLVHRDIKPANILRDLHGTYKLADFGIARVSDQKEELTRTGMVMGTWAYMPPEQREDSREVDPRSDIYAFGVTLYVLATGKISQSLHNQEGWIEAYADVPPQLATIIQRSTRLFPEDRYATMKEMVAELVALEQALGRGDLEPTPIPDLAIFDDRATFMPSATQHPELAISNPTLYPDPAMLEAFDDEIATQDQPVVRRTGLLLAAIAIALVSVAGAAGIWGPGLLRAARDATAPVEENVATAEDVTTHPDLAEPPDGSATPEGTDAPPSEPTEAAVATTKVATKASTSKPAETKGPRIISIVPDAGGSTAASTGTATTATKTPTADATGTVVVRTVPSGATVRLGKRVLTPGAGGGFELPIGTHTLEIESSNGESTRRAVEVRASKTVELCWSFDTNSACSGSR